MPAHRPSPLTTAKEFCKRLSQLKDGIAAGRLALLDLPWRTRPPVAELGIAYKRDRTLPPVGRTLINLIRKRVRAVERS